MSLLASLLTALSPHRAAPNWQPAKAPSLYRAWSACPEALLRRRPSRSAFTSAEAAAAVLWSARQRSWGLRAVLRAAAGAAPTVLEVFGPDELVPHCILYATDDGVQIDEFSGDSRLYPALEAALHDIAPLL